MQSTGRTLLRSACRMEGMRGGDWKLADWESGQHKHRFAQITSRDRLARLVATVRRSNASVVWAVIHVFKPASSS